MGKDGLVDDLGDGVVDVGDPGEVTLPSLFSRFNLARRFLNHTWQGNRERGLDFSNTYDIMAPSCILRGTSNVMEPVIIFDIIFTIHRGNHIYIFIKQEFRL